VEIWLEQTPTSAITVCSTPWEKLGSGKFQAFVAIHSETGTAAQQVLLTCNRTFDPRLIGNYNSMKFFQA
jgi:hypothetical protein